MNTTATAEKYTGYSLAITAYCQTCNRSHRAKDNELMGLQAAYYHDRNGVDWAALRQALGEWKKVSQYFFNDFYVLTPYRGTRNDGEWTAYMYFDAAKNAGAVQAFRPAGCAESAFTVQLKGLAAEALYLVSDADGAVPERKVRGSELLGGLHLYAARPRTALLLYIRGC